MRDEIWMVTTRRDDDDDGDDHKNDIYTAAIQLSGLPTHSYTTIWIAYPAILDLLSSYSTGLAIQPSGLAIQLSGLAIQLFLAGLLADIYRYDS